MTRLMHEGYSWSGRERKCAYLNMGDGGFVDVSAVTGLDFDDDGRAVAVTDWDGDGDLDLWMKNRTGPVVRFMQNAGTDYSHFLEIKLVGKTCNRDAIGAKVTVETGGRKLVRFVSAGDGYLSQSSKTLHFGLGISGAAHGETGHGGKAVAPTERTAETAVPPLRIDRVTIAWPVKGGQTQELTSLLADKRYVVTQGEASPVEMPARAVILPEAPPEPLRMADVARIVLKEPLPLPPTITALFAAGEGSARPRLIVPWAQWCAPCVAELAHLAKHNDSLQRVGIDVLPLNLDKPEDRAKAERLFAERIAPAMTGKAFADRPASEAVTAVLDAILHHVRDVKGDWPLPMSLLVATDGTLQVVCLGTPGAERLLADIDTFGKNQKPAHERSSFPGRWYFRTPRDLAGLAKELRERGREEDAKSYEGRAASSP